MVHHLIAQLPLTEVWTTNYDDLLERACPKAIVRSRDGDLSHDPHPDRRIIYKMHGELKIVGAGRRFLPGIVITREDYETYSSRYPRLWAQLVATFATKSMLFIGFGFNDPNLSHLFALARTRFRKHYRNHFTVLRRPTASNDLLLHKYRMMDLEAVGIHTIEVSSFSEITTILQQLLVRSCPPRVFVSGSYEGSEHDEFCEMLGVALADEGVGVVSGANRPGQIVSYALGDRQQVLHRYDPDDIVLYYQSKSTSPVMPVRRLGIIRYFGSDRRAMRADMVNRCRATVVIGGGEGTREEAMLSGDSHVPVIPVGGTGGTAGAIWREMLGTLSSIRYDGRKVNRNTFKSLNSPSVEEKRKATVALLRQAMYLDV